MVGGRQRRPKLRAVASKHQKERRKRKKRERERERGGGGGGLVGWGRWLGWVEVVEKKEKCELLLGRSQVAMTHVGYHSVALHAPEMVKKFWQPKWVKISFFYCNGSIPDLYRVNKQQRLLFPEI
jgi:hypothetical protein